MLQRRARSRRPWLSLAVTLLALLVVLILAGTAEGATALEPTPTTTPDSPGIVMASAAIDLPDPFVLAGQGKYYLFTSTAFGSTLKIPVIIGSSGHWSKPKEALASMPSWATPANEAGLEWAPSIHKFGSTYVMYYAPTLRGSFPVQHCIAVATAKSRAGPYTSLPNPFVCNRTEGGDIDAEVFVDPAGVNGASHPNYLIWKSDNNSTPGSGIPATWAQPLSNNGLELTGTPVRIYQADQPWQHSLIEAPQMVTSPSGGVYLFYSASGFAAPDYAMGVAQCVGPLGPCTDVSPNPLVASNSQGPGPGEETAFTAGDGSLWLLYNPWYSAAPFYPFMRPAEAIRIGWNSSGPFVAQAGTFPSPG
jgi:beta-xylosidase